MNSATIRPHRNIVYGDMFWFNFEKFLFQINTIFVVFYTDKFLFEQFVLVPPLKSSSRDCLERLSVSKKFSDQNHFKLILNLSNKRAIVLTDGS